MSSRLFDRSQRDTLDDIVPVHNLRVTLRLSGRARRAALAPAGLELPLSLEGQGRQSLSVPEVKEHEMVLVDLE